MEKVFFHKNWLVVFIIFICFFQIHIAFAQNNLSDSVTIKRIKIIQQMLNDGKSNASLWWNGWLIGHSVATSVQGTIYFTSDDEKMRQDMALGAASTFLGAMGQIFSPMTPSSAPQQLAEHPESTPEERANKLLLAEELLRKSADREMEGKSWQTHVIAGVVNFGSGFIVWRGFNRSIWEGVANFLLNTATTEIQIWSQPTKAIEDYENYFKIKAGEKLTYQKKQTGCSVVASFGQIGIYYYF